MTIAEFVNKVGFEVKQEDVKEVNNAIAGLKGTATKLLGAIGIGVSVTGIKNAINACISLASEAEEMQNKFDTVFQGMTEDVENWAQNYADSIGRNVNDIKTYISDAQNLLVGFMGTDRRKEAAELSEAMTSLALDLASFSNVDEQVAVNAMQKAVMGESEAAKTIGAVLNENTRASAMLTLGLTGTYDALDQATKMMVNYQAIVEQSPDAIGDCERSVDSYRSTLLAYQAKQKEINTLIGQFFMPTAQKVIKLGAQGLTLLRDLMIRVNNFADSIGGAERIIAVLGVTLGALVLLANKAAIAKGLKNVLSVLSKIKLQTVGVAAGFLLLALAVDDFVAFMMGHDSIFGTMLEKAGIDLESTREKFRSVFEAIRIIIVEFGGGLVSGFLSVFQGLNALWDEYGDDLLAGVGKVIGIVANLVDALFGWIVEGKTAGEVANGLGQLIAFLASAFAILFPVFNLGIGIIGKLIATFKTLAPLFGLIKTGATGLIGVIGGLSPPVLIAIAVIAALVAAGVLLYKNWDTVKEKAQELYGKLVDTWENIKNGVKEKALAVKDSTIEAINGAVDFVKSLPAQAVTWGADIIDGIVSGIKGAAGRVKEGVAGVASEIKSFLGFSVPDEGPLSDFDTYMPDMIDLMVKGIQEGRQKVRDIGSVLASDIESATGLDVRGAVQCAATAVKTLGSANTVSGATMRSVTNSSVSKNVVQNVNINNQFNGDTAVQKKAATAMDKSAKDATSELARGLAYAR